MKNFKKVLYCFVISLFIFGCDSITSKMSEEVGKSAFRGLDDKYLVCSVDNVNVYLDNFLKCGNKKIDKTCAEENKLDECLVEYESRVLEIEDINSFFPKEVTMHIIDLPMDNIDKLPEGYYLCEKIKLQDDKDNSKEYFNCYISLSDKVVKSEESEYCSEELLESEEKNPYNISKEDCRNLIKIVPVSVNISSSFGDFMRKFQYMLSEE